MTNGGKDKKYRSIGVKIGIVVAAMQVLSVVLAMTICVFMFNSLVVRMQEERCTNGTNMLVPFVQRSSCILTTRELNIKTQMVIASTTESTCMAATTMPIFTPILLYFLSLPPFVIRNPSISYFLHSPQ